MKQSIIPSVLAALIGVLAAPAFAQSQGDQPVSRAQVKAELAALERAGYYPAYNTGPDYPLNLQAAERKVAAQRVEAGQYGPSTNGTSEAGYR